MISLRESDRRVESKRREEVLKTQRDDFLRSQGIEPVDEDADDVDEDALEEQQEVISRIQAREAASILADALSGMGSERPRAAMRN